MGSVFANASNSLSVLRVPHVASMFANAPYIRLFYEFLWTKVLKFANASLSRVSCLSRSMMRELPRFTNLFERFLASQNYFYAIGFTRIEVVINLRVLPRQTLPVPTLDWF